MSAPASGSSPPARGARASLAVGGELALAFGVAALYEIEGGAFVRVLGIAVLGWLAQHVVPVRLRLAWFLALAAASLVAALGPVDGLLVLATGGVLVVLCLLPGRGWLRLGAVLAAAAILAVCRAGALPVPWGLPAWPILASLFLFRAISFLYDRQHERERPPAGLAAAYFFLPPNA